MRLLYCVNSVHILFLYWNAEVVSVVDSRECGGACAEQGDLATSSYIVSEYQAVPTSENAAALTFAAASDQL